MAYYVSHQQPALSASLPKARQEGFQVHLPPLHLHDQLSAANPPSPPTPTFFSQPSPAFPDSFNSKKFGDHTPNPNSMDFSDTLASMMAVNEQIGDRDSSDRTSLHQTHHHHHHTGTNGVDFSPIHGPHNQFFDVNHQFSHHLQNGFRGTPDSGLGNDSPVQPAHNYFGEPHDFHSFSVPAGPTTLPRINTMRGSSPSATSMMDLSPADSFSSTFSPTPQRAERPGSRSRSRSRAPTSVARPPTASRSRVGKKRTTSISSPSPPGGAGTERGTPSIIIPAINQTNGNSLHSPHQGPGSWMFSPSEASFSLPEGGAFNAATQGFGGHSVPLGGIAEPKSSLNTPADAASKQAAILNEKRRRRRESHNAVERRRRDNINEKITELSTLLPECLLDPTAVAKPGDIGAELGAGGGNPDEEGGNLTAGLKANKGMILRKSVDYIRYLQQLVRAQASRNQDLERQLGRYREANGEPSDPSDSRFLDGLDMGSSGFDDMSGLILSNLTPDADEGSHDIKPFVNGAGASGSSKDPTGARHGTPGNPIGTSPSVGGSASDDDLDDLDEERGRGRDKLTGRARFPGLSAGGMTVSESALSEGEEDRAMGS